MELTCLAMIVLALFSVSASSSAFAANAVHTKLEARTEPQRRQIFQNFITQNGIKCSSVKKTFYQGGDQHKTVYWNASCANGKDWIIAIDAKGGGRVFDCTVGYVLGAGVPCFTKSDR